MNNLFENQSHVKVADNYEASRQHAENVTKSSASPDEIHKAYTNHRSYATAFNAVRNPNTSHETIRSIYTNTNGNFAKHIANHKNTPLDIIEHIKKHNPMMENKEVKMNFRELVESQYEEKQKALNEAKDESPIDENGVHKKSGLIFMNLGIADRHVIDPKDLA